MWEDSFDTENYSAVSWRQYFDQSEDIPVGPSETRDVFRVYRNGTDGPLLVLLHGGGHSALSWAVFTTAIASRVTCRVLAMDLRVTVSSESKGHLRMPLSLIVVMTIRVPFWIRP
ncbi:protein phosphatase methylesterase 1-like [Oncorhynchus masou masou]|uniref:protein phosphatase methylesterase 1-like n=1 Tax=Oncorhynchus masou masou TaxID=90313 RepID=UPI0031834EAF